MSQFPGKIRSVNPATGELLGELDSTRPEELPAIFARARAAQEKWAEDSIRRRAKALLDLRETLLNHVDDLTDLISRENGKPRFEAMMNDLQGPVDMLTYFAKYSRKFLQDRPVKLMTMKHRISYLNHWP